METLFLSYDGALDPLGGSQVLPYLAGLAKHGVSPTLVSFEKPERLANHAQREAVEARLMEARIRWRPLRYHRRPRLPATLWDVLRGVAVVRKEVVRRGVSLVHCRGDVAMWMARLARLGPRVPLLYDVRGFFADERVESGSWARGGLLDRRVRRVESANLARADGMVVLTRAALTQVRLRRPDLPPHRVVPTCVDLGTFSPRLPEARPEFDLIYAGSLGTWYMVAEMVDFARVAARELKGRVLFLTPDVEVARRAGADASWADIRCVPHAEVPDWLRRARAAFFFIRPTPAKRASCPTKLGESLATGLPVVTNSGIGDVDELLNPETGIVLDSFDERSYERAATQLRRLMLDEQTPGRCRELARAQLNLSTAVRSYGELYTALAEGRR